MSAVHKVFAVIRKVTPRWLSNPVRSMATAVLAPAMFGYHTGFFASCFRMKAVAKDGGPLPWYTYPSIDFLKYRNYTGKSVLEFGGGQSTLWWSQRVRRVLTLEGDQAWYEKIRNSMPENVDLRYVTLQDRESNARAVSQIIDSQQERRFDVIVIDGLYREQMVDIACGALAENGIIICDNSDGYEIYERFLRRGLDRIDFYGNAPGVVLPHCTSIYFHRTSFVFDSEVPIHKISSEW